MIIIRQSTYPTQTDDGDVINKRYLESTTNNFFRRDGSESMGGDLNLTNNKIVNVSNADFSSR